jgi:NAD(P)-dependent dehydrogenase (short-subunit alcohol dehydrogenase family)
MACEIGEKHVGRDDFRYDGRRVLVVGGATGMGAAAAKLVAALGGEAVVMDFAPVEYPVAAAIKVDLQDRAGIDAALDQLGGPVDALFSAAGIAGGPGLMKVNFIAHRHMMEQLVAQGLLTSGAAICMISSVAGLGWQANLPMLHDFLSTPDYESADAWVAAHEGSNSYTFSKQAMNAYVAAQAYPLMCRGVRINAICPGPTDTPLAQANSWLGFGQDYREATGAPGLQPEQMANAMVFLNSKAASGISGVNLLVDSGHVMSSIAGSFEPGRPVIEFLMTNMP